jgi:hypothetical protein
MPRGQARNKVQHLKPSPKRKPTKHIRVVEVKQFYQPHSNQKITLSVVRWLARKPLT